jgi:hypothetical protein
VKLGKVVAATAVVAVLLVGAKSAQSQSNPNLESGTRDWGSYHGDAIGVVNLVHGGVDFKIPLVSYPQRGGQGAVEHYFHNRGVLPLRLLSRRSEVCQWLAPRLICNHNWHAHGC